MRLEDIIQTEKAVRCDGTCGEIFLLNSNEFITIHGNITIGFYGGIIGNNFDDNGRLQKVSIFCRDCFYETIERNTHAHEDRKRTQTDI